MFETSNRYFSVKLDIWGRIGMMTLNVLKFCSCLILVIICPTLLTLNPCLHKHADISVCKILLFCLINCWKIQSLNLCYGQTQAVSRNISTSQLLDKHTFCCMPFTEYKDELRSIKCQAAFCYPTPNTTCAHLPGWFVFYFRKFID